MPRKRRSSITGDAVKQRNRKLRRQFGKVDRLRPQLDNPIHQADRTVTMHLNMVCEEDDLSPAQITAFAKAKKDYETSQAKIAEARRNGWIVSESVRRAAPVQSEDEDDVIVLNDTEQYTSTGRPKRRASANVSTISKLLAPGKNVQPVTIAPQQGLTISDVRGGVTFGGELTSNPVITPVPGTSHAALQSLLAKPPAPGSLILAHQVGTNQRVLIPQEHYKKLLPGQFTFIKTVNTKPASAPQLPASLQGAVVAGQQTGRKRSTESSSDTPSKKIRAPREPNFDSDGGKWIPLDEYYYARREGDPVYREEKGKFRFKCWYCHKMLYNNVRLISHMQGHIDSEKQQNLDLADLTQCKHCYKQFDTPYEMQCHVEKVHQNDSEAMLCRICEKDLPTSHSLRQHMRMVHVACEMPYICQLCNFRSSVHGDVVDHFKGRHDSSQNVLCVYCLKVFKIPFTKGNDGWGQTQYFFKHLQMHQIKMRAKKCNQCKLMFVQSHNEEFKAHKRRDHLPNSKGIDVSASPSMKRTLNENLEPVLIQVVDPLAPGTLLKSVNAPTVAKVMELRGIRVYRIPEKWQCWECKTVMNTWDHYKKKSICKLCSFATCCHHSYTNHMMAYHGGMGKKVSLPEKKLDTPLHCLCGYKCSYGNAMASHLVSCSKMTAYFNIPEAKFFEYDDEQEDFNPFEPYVEEPESPEVDSNVPTMFTALGLVKRSVKSANGSSGSKVAPQSSVDTRKYSTDPLVSPSKPPMKVLQPQHRRSSLLSSLPIKVPIAPQNEDAPEGKEGSASVDTASEFVTGSSNDAKDSDQEKESPESKVMPMQTDPEEDTDAVVPEKQGDFQAPDGSKDKKENVTETLDESGTKKDTDMEVKDGDAATDISTQVTDIIPDVKESKELDNSDPSDRGAQKDTDVQKPVSSSVSVPKEQTKFGAETGFEKGSDNMTSHSDTASPDQQPSSPKSEDDICSLEGKTTEPDSSAGPESENVAQGVDSADNTEQSSVADTLSGAEKVNDSEETASEHPLLVPYIDD